MQHLLYDAITDVTPEIWSRVSIKRSTTKMRPEARPDRFIDVAGVSQQDAGCHQLGRGPVILEVSNSTAHNF
ncbi:hypothetical protein J6590_071606 [Homalodisca vitripennis]|nr:hypothetical protein J6590_071606 [Homalodisca vitripennis]